MLLRTLTILIVHVIVVILLFVSTTVNAWTVGEISNSDLWSKCFASNGGYHCKPTPTGVWIQLVQGLMVLSVLYSVLAFLFFLCQLFTLQKGGRFFLTGIFQILASLLVMSAAAVYTVQSSDWVQEREGFGFSYILAWMAFPLALLSGLVYMILRKVE
ncbi:hypothetical protein COCON_G00207260 [Conger conger]|uniref:Peripheral myelin protein 22 n=1 Tax=Conger conger TaxID=82655 RepID=A0A9Q1CZW5_CONCO|nr:peripheral myelin protein 22-like [Conger conger]KAJ8254114.1 hypothetical protein COCON_G00207260 [Conger conger]